MDPRRLKPVRLLRSHFRSWLIPHVNAFGSSYCTSEPLCKVISDIQRNAGSVTLTARRTVWPRASEVFCQTLERELITWENFCWHVIVKLNRWWLQNSENEFSLTRCNGEVFDLNLKSSSITHNAPVQYTMQGYAMYRIGIIFPRERPFRQTRRKRAIKREKKDNREKEYDWERKNGVRFKNMMM